MLNEVNIPRYDVSSQRPMLSDADSMKHRTYRDHQLQWLSSPNPNGVVSIVFRHNGPMRLM